jgi:RNA polymerase sigma factor (sigma-70 family)
VVDEAERTEPGPVDGTRPSNGSWTGPGLAAWIDDELPRLSRWARRWTGPASRGVEDDADLCQEICLALVEAHERRALPDPQAADAWLRTVAHRVAVNRLRRRGARLEEPFPAVRSANDLVHTTEDDEPLAELIRSEDRILLQRALNEIPDRQRDVLEADLEGLLDPATLSRAIGCSPNAVRLLRARGLRRLRRKLSPSRST